MNKEELQIKTINVFCFNIILKNRHWWVKINKQNEMEKRIKLPWLWSSLVSSTRLWLSAICEISSTWWELLCCLTDCWTWILILEIWPELVDRDSTFPHSKEVATHGTKPDDEKDIIYMDRSSNLRIRTSATQLRRELERFGMKWWGLG